MYANLVESFFPQNYLKLLFIKTFSSVLLATLFTLILYLSLGSVTHEPLFFLTDKPFHLSCMTYCTGNSKGLCSLISLAYIFPQYLSAPSTYHKLNSLSTSRPHVLEAHSFLATFTTVGQNPSQWVLGAQPIRDNNYEQLPKTKIAWVLLIEHK